MGKFLNWLLGWLGIALVAYCGVAVSLLAGFLLYGVAITFSPEPDLVSGINTVPWFAWVERGIMLTAAALAGSLLVLFAVAAAERPQKRIAAWLAMAVGTAIALMMAANRGLVDGDLQLEAVVLVCSGMLALYRVHRQLNPKLQQARIQARSLARKEARKAAQMGNGNKQGGRRRGLFARRAIPRLQAPSRHHRRRPPPQLDPGSPVPAIGKAGMASLVLLVLWVMFMIIMLVNHNPASLETETLLRFWEMFSWWMWAALLSMLFLLVELAGRAVTSPQRHLRRLSTDLFALILMTLMAATSGQFAQMYAVQHRDRLHAYIPSHAIGRDFSYPSLLAPGSTVNREWLEFQKWLDEYVDGTPTVRLEFRPQQPVRHLAQCTPDLWRAQCDEIRFCVGDGPEHRLLNPGMLWPDVLLAPEDGSLNGLLRMPAIETGAFRDQVSHEEYLRGLPGRGLVEPEELERMIQEAKRRYPPLQILVSRDASLQWLDLLLRRLEERGAESFNLFFYE